MFAVPDATKRSGNSDNLQSIGLGSGNNSKSEPDDSKPRSDPSITIGLSNILTRQKTQAPNKSPFKDFIKPTMLSAASVKHVLSNQRQADNDQQMEEASILNLHTYAMNEGNGGTPLPTQDKQPGSKSGSGGADSFKNFL